MRVLAMLGRGALFMAGGAGVLWIGALPPALLCREDDPRAERDIESPSDGWLGALATSYAAGSRSQTGSTT